MIRSAKRLTYTLLRASGATSLISKSAWRQRRLLILCYHGVSLDDEHEWSDLYVSRTHLQRRCELLRNGGYAVVPLHVAVDLMLSGDLPDRAVSLTFDDGSHDFIVNAAPLLQSFDFHTTLYLTTYYSPRCTPVFDPMLSYLLWKGRGSRVRLDSLNSGEHFVIPRSLELLRALHARLRLEAQGHLEEQKQATLRELAQQLGADYERILEQRLLQIMTPEEVRLLDRNRVDIQLHTHRHRMPDDEVLFKREIADNRRAIVEITGDPSWRGIHFCYPNGVHHPRYLPWLEDLGIRSATTCEPGFASPASSLLTLPRFIDTMETTEAAFLAWMSGAAQHLPRR